MSLAEDFNVALSELGDALSRVKEFVLKLQQVPEPAPPDTPAPEVVFTEEEVKAATAAMRNLAKQARELVEFSVAAVAAEEVIDA